MRIGEAKALSVLDVLAHEALEERALPLARLADDLHAVLAGARRDVELLAGLWESLRYCWRMSPARRIRSTSRSTAETEPIVLRLSPSGTRRLLFRPMLVDNPNDQEAAVNGEFVYQRKGKGDTWEDFPTAPLSALKKGEAVKLALHSAEVLHLYRELTALYAIYERNGIPLGETSYVRASQHLEELAKMPDAELAKVLSATHAVGLDGLAALLRWAIAEGPQEALADKLAALGASSIRELGIVTGLAALKEALRSWSENRDNADEEFWQEMLAKQTLVLEQLFAYPVVVVHPKAYVGGKTIRNRGGKIVDFLVENRATKGAGLVEIKTAQTRLLGPEYRDGVHSISKELSGAVLQVLNYRETLLLRFDSLVRELDRDLEPFDPKCTVILGHAREELTSRAKRRSFELFRRQLSNVDVVTFDEMFDRTKRLIEAIEGGGSSVPR